MRVSPRSLRPLRLGWVGPCGVFEHGDAALEIAPVGPGSLDRILSYRTLPKTQLIWNDRCQHLGLSRKRVGGEFNTLL